MSANTGSDNHSVPFITLGIGYRDDFQDTGSWILRTFSFLDRNLSGSPISTNTYPKFAVRVASGSVAPSKGFIVTFYSGSTVLGFMTGSGTKFSTWTGSLTLNSSVDRIVLCHGNFNNVITYRTDGDVLHLRYAPAPDASNQTYNLDFIQLYKENLELRYINNPSTYSLKKRIIELSPPMREQGILQHLGADSPRISLDGIIISDSDFTAQQYRDKLVNVWQEGNWQWLNTDMINYKFQPEDLSITQLPGIVDYYRFELGLRQYTTISAQSGSYNLA